MSNPERFNPDSPDFKIQTARHHFARYNFALSHIQNQSCLDLCCGFGYGTNLIAEQNKGWTTIGVDIDGPTIIEARKKYPNCVFVESDIQKLRAKSILHISFDSIVLFEALEHFSFEEGRQLLNNIATLHGFLTRPHGQLIISTPRDTNLDENHFHKSTWSLDDLKTNLEPLFGTVKIYGQEWETGIIDDVQKYNDFYIAVCQL